MASKTPSELKELQDLVVKFCEKRDWMKFHNPKDTSLSLVLEAAEVMEHFQWTSEKEMQDYVKTHKT